MTEQEIKPFNKIEATHHKKYKPLVIDWLVKRFSLPAYDHSFKDQWINVSIWDGELTISFDTRQPEQVTLFNSIPDQFKGCPQRGTGIIVNKDNLYFYFDKEWQIKYPSIKSSKIISETKHVDNDGDIFFTYDHVLNLSDDTQVIYHNQSKSLDIVDYVFRTIIQQRFFFETIFNTPHGGGTELSINLEQVKV